MKEYAILIDTTYCTGCNTCMYKCVQENRLHSQAGQGLARTVVTIGDEGLYHERCLHCQTPACLEVCPEKAITKTEYGPVLYDASLCVGCEACVDECPFHIPKLDPITQKIVRCSLCAHRLVQGRAPACVEACSTGALVFDEYSRIVSQAKEKAARDKLHIYGLNENGGGHLIVLTRNAPTAIGYPEVASRSGRKTPDRARVEIPAVAALMVGGLKMFSDRRAKIEKNPDDQ